MKISKIYSNLPNIFEPINFNDGFNVIIGEIQLHSDHGKDSHNLGKSKLADLIDFGFLKKRSKEMFLFKHLDRFASFTFYFEVKLNDGKFITIRRSVSDNSKIYIKRHDYNRQNFTDLPDNEWDYKKLAIANAKLLLDSILNLTSISPWDYRMAISYALRRQDDFNDIFQLKKFGSKHIHWKPYIGHLLGFNAENLTINYELKNSIDKINEKLIELQKEIGLYQGDEEEMLKDTLSVWVQEAHILEEQLDSFNFDAADTNIVEELSEHIDTEIDELNRIRYYINTNLKKLRKAESKQPTDFNISKTEQLFKEAGVIFGEQIKKSYSQLVEFNHKITIERSGFVKKQIYDLEQQLLSVTSRLTELNTQKSQRVSFLTNTNTFEKYKEVSNRLVRINTEIHYIHSKLEISEQIKARKSESRLLSNQKSEVVEKIRLDRESVTHSETSIYKLVKENFSTFVKLVLDKDGRISTEQNQEGNLVFHAGFINGDFNFTSESDGCSYKKILCMGYDLAISLAYSNKNFIRFIYHDGGLETLDSRKKIEFLKYVRIIPELYGIQYILTVIDSDLPEGVEFTEDEIALKLHDNGNDGLLFKMPPW
ncbi:DUF2326 domain-containing protein [Rahnella ecdela]|uniref:DUF2326 domain-containing protein n=1 Tax=Rahnella ecdela TaxID=2816250 RepID=A0ABS6LMH6_9GAMM|nr:DUF2326 domain-containing protein [Rahnella ecdela]MBU9848052.1 DUF2326 domain-containing protein [Rahnella ecdela]